MPTDVLAPTPVPVAASDVATDEGPFRWTVARFFALSEAGLLDGPGRYELIDGTIYFMPTQSAAHFTVIRLIAQALRRLLDEHPEQLDLRVQGPLVFDDRSYVEPDLAVVKGTIADYAERHPDVAMLAVEVSHTSYPKDSGVKRAVYAQAGIGEYWIVNLPERRVEVYRDPREAEYDTRFTFTSDRPFAPLFAPGAELRAADLLP